MDYLTVLNITACVLVLYIYFGIGLGIVGMLKKMTDHAQKPTGNHFLVFLFWPIVFGMIQAYHLPDVQDTIKAINEDQAGREAKGVYRGPEPE
jgi:hypothetical protein